MRKFAEKYRSVLEKEKMYKYTNILLNIGIAFWFIQFSVFIIAPFIGGVFVPEGVITYGSLSIQLLLAKQILSQMKRFKLINKKLFWTFGAFSVYLNFILFDKTQGTVVSILLVIFLIFYYYRYLLPKYSETTT
ncbi:MAG: hypothetical protein FP813_06740 [Desulfurivibrio sp.]|nr:hypothetical protein [Desulfurivibrio sp.]MBU4119788.1 hypothetical protein [Pseudomonadota bacterium]